MKITLKELRSLVRNEVRKKYLRETQEDPNITNAKEAYNKLIIQYSNNPKLFVAELPKSFYEKINILYFETEKMVTTKKTEYSKIENNKNPFGKINETDLEKFMKEKSEEIEKLKKDPFVHDIIEASAQVSSLWDKGTILVKNYLKRNPKIYDHIIKANVHVALGWVKENFEQSLKDMSGLNPQYTTTTAVAEYFKNYLELFEDWKKSKIFNSRSIFDFDMSQIPFRWIGVGNLQPNDLYEKVVDRISEEAIGEKLSNEPEFTERFGANEKISSIASNIKYLENLGKIRTESLRRIVREEITRQLRSRR